jgi:precorrin-2 dehydrogenase/sirohydrochlorin ferrochelatase
LQAAGGEIRHLAREYHYGDLRGNTLVYVATENHEVVHCAVREARELGILLNVVDNPECSTFISPAVIKRGDLQIAISTSGSSPAVARMLRQRLEQQIGPGYAFVLEIMRRARQFLHKREANQRARACILKSLAGALLDSIETLDFSLIDEALRQHVHVSMAELGLDHEIAPSGLASQVPQRPTSKILQ